MKSRLRFALDGNNKAVIDGNIEHSEDLRDEVALQFRQNFKTTGNLATFNFCNGTNSQFKITPHGGDPDECRDIASRLSMFQLENLSFALEVEKNNRLGNLKKDSVSDGNLDLRTPLSFDELVQHGLNNGATVVNGMPWSWKINGKAVSHENNECYIIETINGDEHFHKGTDRIIAFEHGLKILVNHTH